MAVIMCNSYRITPKHGLEKGFQGKVSAAASKLKNPLIRISDPGIVMLADERVETMRWGFQRSFNAAINNARSDKLESGMWAEAFRERRCVIPMSLFYEWGPGNGGRKQAHEFRHPDDDYLWVAGLWENQDGVGRCYTMVTTAAPPLMAPIHQRMPAVLGPDEIFEYLDTENRWDFRPYDGPIDVSPCESPLAKPRGMDSQPELF